MCAGSESWRDYVRLDGFKRILFRNSCPQVPYCRTASIQAYFSDIFVAHMWQPGLPSTFMRVDRDPPEGYVLSGTEPPTGSGGHNTLPPVHRRDWLCSVGGLLGLLLLDPASILHEPGLCDAEPEGWLRGLEAGVLGDDTALRRLGAAYLHSNSLEGGRRRLSRLLSRDASASVWLTLIQNIARDWVDHDVIVVNGWVMARTEARICAILHLMNGSRA
jgi:hypothetical protein